ncbi:outer membrane protein [Cellulophaga sp. L1A9]|uniref:outer membrane protein n=1 Tax=Cellulophaga sp. L1A9 TaxID=2686362 RepID=UPI00131C18FD|nr:outer membrane beta-barrel protein [Cellulophaga sp. L1A9]
MKNSIILFSAFLISVVSYGQLQVSASTGYAVPSAGMKLGTTMTETETENSYGSFGEGVNVQLRGTYFFKNSLGIDVSLGYLNGTDQDISVVNTSTEERDAIARARAFGAAVSLAYKFNDNVYGRLGALLKVAGKTEAVVYSKSTFSDAQAAGLGLPSGSYSETNYKEDFHGHFPLGLVAALGYNYDINSNFSIFAEAEYYGISLKRKDSEITEFNTDIVTPDGNVAVAGFNSLDNLPDGFNKTTTFVDTLSDDETDETKVLSQKVPYSSFGINFGITYKFKPSNKE